METLIKKNVCILIPLLRHGGSERFVSNLSKILNKKYNLFLFSFDSANKSYYFEGKIINLNLPPLPKRNIFGKIIVFFKRIILVSNNIQEYNIECVFSIGLIPTLITAFVSKKIIKISSLRTYENILYFKNIFFKSFWGFIFNKYFFFLLPSEEMKIEFLKIFPKYINKVKVISNPVDNDEILKASFKKAFFNFDPSLFYMCSLGTYIPRKGHFEVIKALNILLKTNDKFRLIIMGNDFQNHKFFLENYLKENSIQDKVFIFDFLENPFPIIANVNLYITCSFLEGFPNNILEAMVLGRPIIAYDCKSGPKEILMKNPNSITEKTGIIWGDYGILIKTQKNEILPDKKESDFISFNISQAIEILFNNRTLLQNYSNKSVIRSKDYVIETFEEKLEPFLRLLN